MRFFHDAEFLEDGKTIDLLSYAIVAESGDELYLINADADWERVSAHPWLRDNVLPYLPGAYCFGANDQWRPDETSPRVVRRKVLAERVRQFIASYGENRSEHELWAWYGAYDHVALAQLFGRMLDLPACVPMHTNDLKTLVGENRVPGSLRAKVGGEHDALADAQWDRLVYAWAQEMRLARERTREGWAVERSEQHRQCFALWVAWAGLSEKDRAALRATVPDATLFLLLDDLKGVLEK